MQGGDNMKSVFAGNKAKFAYFSFIFIIISTAMYTFYAKEPHGGILYGMIFLL